MTFSPVFCFRFRNFFPIAKPSSLKYLILWKYIENFKITVVDVLKFDSAVKLYAFDDFILSSVFSTTRKQ